MDLFIEINEFYHEHRYVEVKRKEELPDNRLRIIFIELDKLEAIEKKPMEECCAREESWGVETMLEMKQKLSIND